LWRGPPGEGPEMAESLGVSANIELWFNPVLTKRLPMSTMYTIGPLAKAAGVPASTVRFYERRGLLTPDQRSGGNYRRYGRAALERLRFIRAAQAAGFTLKDIELLLEFRDGDAAPCGEVQALIASRLARIEQEIQHLAHVREVLTRWMGVCRRAAKSGRCAVLEGLGQPCECDDAEACDKKSRKRTKPP